MTNLKEATYNIAPHFLQEIMISMYNMKAYKTRHSGQYRHFRNLYESNANLSLLELQAIQKVKYAQFVNHIMKASPFYNRRLSNIENVSDISNIRQIPIINKEDVRQNASDIYTVEKEKSEVSKTGGTTGKSLEVRFTKFDSQERHAVLDNFRKQSADYELGKKTAWFSGKALLSSRDVKKNRFWKTDHLNNVRYYSTFHIQTKFLGHYLENLIHYKPQYLVGFPSTICEIAKYGRMNNIAFPANIIKGIFPTAETITDEIRELLETYFKAPVFDQYASSEGAPFIAECPNGSLHMELQTGVFEVLDKAGNPCDNGRLICTPFNTYGTPLLRYDIGDNIELSDEKCDCGNNNPLVKKIHGRNSDFIFSPETGQINLGNVSNCLKGVKGVIRFQMIQDELNHLKVLMEIDESLFNEDYKKFFVQNIRDRIGNKMALTLDYVDTIPTEKSGKFRLVKNNLKNKSKL